MPVVDQETKDMLWNLDETTEAMTSEISKLTGEAWKAYVEQGNYQRPLDRARQIARDLMNKIESTQDWLPK
jgi:hypothetical protein